MFDQDPDASTVARRFTAVTSVLVFVALMVGPYVGRLRHASLYTDDVVRIAQLQTEPLGALLFRPFNEHMAPLFQLVSWLTWQAAGRSLARAPICFTVASYVPFLLGLGLLARVIRRETGSFASSMVGVAVFGMSWLAIETVFWYSASSFMWALAGATAAWLGAAGSASDPRRFRRAWRTLSLFAAASAPAFSAIGLLAGPAAAIRGMLDDRPVRRRDRLLTAAAPLAGTLLYFAVCLGFRYQDVLAGSLKHHANFGPGLFAAVRAPVEALLPALFGFGTIPARGFATFLTFTLSAGASLVAAPHAIRQPADRPLIAGGLFLVFGGYAMAFCARADVAGHPAIETQRYHLFPMLGLVLLLVPVLKRGLVRWETAPAEGLRVVAVLTLGLWALHAREMDGRERFLRYPDQARTLAAIDRLGAVCGRTGVSRDQALAALDPIETEWTPPGHNALILLPANTSASDVPARSVKSMLLSHLSADDRRSVCGGMDATPYVLPAGDKGSAEVVGDGRPVKLFRVRELSPGRYETPGWPSFVEYAMSATEPASAVAMEFDGDVPEGVVEVWWRGDQERWSETRSVRIRLGAGGAPLGGTCRLPLDQLPHWEPGAAGRVRMLFHEAGELAARPPRLVR